MIFFMVLVSNSAMAKWINVSSGDDDSRYYFDMDTKRKNKNIVKVWVLSDYKTAIEGDLSAKRLQEFDCKDSTLRSVAGSYYTGNMGSGNVTTSINKVNDWRPVIPETIGETLWKYACGKNEVSEAALTDNSLIKWTLVDSGDKLNTYLEMPELRESKTKKKPVKEIVSKLSKVKVWTLWDYKENKTSFDNIYNYLSAKILVEFDCNENNYRQIKFAQYSDNMGVGNVMWSADDKPDVNWDPITPDSVMEVLMQKACGQ